MQRCNDVPMYTYQVRTAATFVSAIALRCAAPDRLPVGAAAVGASLDGVAFSAPSVAASYLSYDSRLPPDVAAAVPSWGDISGAGAPIVVSGRNLAPTARIACVFDEVGRTAATVLDAGSVTCAATASVTYGCSLHCIRLQVRGSGHAAAARPFTYGYSLSYIRLQVHGTGHAAAAHPVTYGYNLYYIRLQPQLNTVTGAQPRPRCCRTPRSCA